MQSVFRVKFAHIPGGWLLSAHRSYAVGTLLQLPETNTTGNKISAVELPLLNGKDI